MHFDAIDIAIAALLVAIVATMWTAWRNRRRVSPRQRVKLEERERIGRVKASQAKWGEKW